MTFAMHEAERFIDDLRAEIRAMVQKEIADQQGAFRAYAWSIGDPEPDPPPETPLPAPPPFVIEVPCKPVDLMASCIVAPGSTASFTIQRSIDAGVTWESIQTSATTIASGAFFGSLSNSLASFMWEELIPTRALQVPGYANSEPMWFRPGDMIKLTFTPAGAKSISVQIRTQRLGEHPKRGR